MAKFTNSPLVSYTKISPHRTKNRNHSIDTITIHCVVGQCSVETIGNVFAAPDRRASSNYGIGPDGRIGMYCEEKDRSWCTGGKDRNGNTVRVNGMSGGDNDHRAITIEVASDTKPPYAVKDKAFKALIDLVTDICKRNDIKQLKWKGDKSLVGNVAEQNMTVHRWFSTKSCPGDYLYERMGQIAAEVNARLAPTLYRVQVGAFKRKSNAQTLQKQLKAAGFDTYIVLVNNLYKVQVGAYSKKSNAVNMQAKLKAKQFDGFITTESGTST